jgi:hypothetical protein
VPQVVLAAVLFLVEVVEVLLQSLQLALLALLTEVEVEVEALDHQFQVLLVLLDLQVLLGL